MTTPTIAPATQPDKYDYKSICVLANDHTAYALADHLADVMPETLSDGRSIWTLTSFDLAILAHNNYPGGAEGLQFALEDLGD